SGGRGGFEDIDLEELFGAFGGGGRAKSGFGGGFGGGKGQDVRATLDISLEDAIAGTTRRIQFSDGRMLDVAIPKGASEGQVIRLKGQGAPGRGGQAGDALIELKIAPHPVFKRDGADLTMDLPVSVPDAVLGGKIQVPTPEGAVMMTIPKGSNSGKVLRLKGRGAYAGGKRGDLLAKLAVTLPETPDDELIRFATEWRDKRPYKPGR
ncbi:molecular chaperone DnaJ, partial [Sulfolobus sp. A20-N-F8]